MRISVGGGTPEFAGVSTKTIRQLALNSDGSRLAYTDGETATAEWWALENILAKSK
jgi:hypothetical protein